MKLGPGLEWIYFILYSINFWIDCFVCMRLCMKQYMTINDDVDDDTSTSILIFLFCKNVFQYRVFTVFRCTIEAVDLIR